MSSVLLETLHQASFKGAKFLYSSQTESSGRKNVVHEYPNTDTRYVQDLGKLPRTFNIVGIISNSVFQNFSSTLSVSELLTGEGKADNYYTQRTLLLNALNDEGSGLLIHPYEGSIQAFCTTFTMDESLNAFNTIRFNMTFMETGDAVFPDTSESFATNIESEFDNFIDSISTDISSLWSTGFGLLNNFNFSKDLLENLLDTFENIPNQLSSLTDSYFDFAKSLTDFATNINTSTTEASSLTATTNSLFDTAGALSDDVLEQYVISQTFFAYDKGAVSIQTTVGLAERELNRRILNQYLNSQALIFAYTFTTRTTFETQDDVQTRSDELNAQFEFIILNNIYTDIEGVKSNLLSDDSLSLLEDLRSEAHSYLRAQTTTTQNIVDIKLIRNSLIPLTYLYYGDLDLKDAIYDLNKLRKGTNLTGDFKIIQQSDTNNV